ncbi:MAG: hypothetical protein QNJ16_11240 [Rhodobacter sp.]|nr:hypothetical protein [Rhodobacter sp.]
MKKLALTTVIALGVAAPALAQTQLEASVGAEAGQYTLSELVQLKDAATRTSNEGRVYFGNEQINFSAKNQHNGTARSIFATLAEESRDND